MAPTDPDFYAILGVQFAASGDEIKRKYRNYVHTYHPDKNPGQDKSLTEKYHQTQAAYQCLSNTTRRLVYDMRNFGKSSLSLPGSDDETCSGGAMAKLSELQKEQAAIDLSNMQNTLEKVLKREIAKKGVIIKNAWYGDLRLQDDKLVEGFAGKRTILVSDLRGPVIDVAKPVQALVEKSAIILQGGVLTSKSDLPGFYNPAPWDSDVKLELYVLYEFRAQLHEVIVGDRDMLSLPKRPHMIPHTDAPRGPFSNWNMSPPLAVSAATALEQAVAAYRYAAMNACCRGDATPREFVAFFCSVAAVAYFALHKLVA